MNEFTLFQGGIFEHNTYMNKFFFFLYRTVKMFAPKI